MSVSWGTYGVPVNSPNTSTSSHWLGSNAKMHLRVSATGTRTSNSAMSYTFNFQIRGHDSGTWWNYGSNTIAVDITIDGKTTTHYVTNSAIINSTSTRPIGTSYLSAGSETVSVSSSNTNNKSVTITFKRRGGTSASWVSVSRSFTNLPADDMLTVTISFNVNGGSGTVSSQTVLVGSTFTFPSAPTAPASTSTNTNFTIKTSANGGYYPSTYTASKTATKTVTTPKVFNGWGGSSSSTSGSSAGSTGTAPSSNKTYYATWINGTSTTTYSNNDLSGLTLPSHNPNTGSFVIKGDRNLGDADVSVNASWSQPVVYKCWCSTSSSSGGTEYSTSSKFYSTTTVYARWTEQEKVFSNNTIDDLPTPVRSSSSTSFIIRGVSHSDDCPDQEITATKSQSYTFDGWYTSATGGTKYTSSTGVFTETTTVYAHWNNGTVSYSNNSISLLDETYKNQSVEDFTIYCDYNNGKTPRDVEPISAHKYTEYTFDGWYTSATGGTKYSIGATFTTSTTVHAQYNNTYTYSNNSISDCPTPPELVDSSYFSITGNLNYSEADPQSIVVQAVKKERRLFTGWYDSREDGVPYDEDDTFTEPTTIYAHYIRVKDLFSNNKISALGTPTRENHTFLGWTNSSSGTEIYSDDQEFFVSTEVYALWKINGDIDIWKVFINDSDSETSASRIYLGSQPVHLLMYIPDPSDSQ